MPIIMFFGSQAISLVALLIGSGYTNRSLAQIFATLSCVCATHVILKMVFKSTECINTEKWSKVQVLGFLSLYDIFSLLASISVGILYVATGYAGYQNILALACVISILHVVRIPRFFHVILTAIVWYLI